MLHSACDYSASRVAMDDDSGFKGSASRAVRLATVLRVGTPLRHCAMMIAQIECLSQTVVSAPDLHLVDTADWPWRTRKQTLIGYITAEVKDDGFYFQNQN